MLRPLDSVEFSDGTLRFLCLVVALLSRRPPQFMALNEPENSLHEDLLPALAHPIAEASQFCQLWITSHSPRLAHLIVQHAPVNHIRLEAGERCRRGLRRSSRASRRTPLVMR